jgi:succinate dehydrogenase / fumarate reductase cytochrome b subunit
MVRLVATQTLSVHQKAVRSSVAMKALMAVTGIFLILFLLVHMWGNLKAFIGAEAYDHYAEWLKSDILYPLVPQGWFIWIFRVFMVACIVLHMFSAYVLSRRSQKGRGHYQRSERRAQTFAARTMRWGGVILLMLLLFHLGQFTVKVFLTGFNSTATPYEAIVLTFQQWYMVVLYALFVGTVCLHVRHGVWSALTTLGANTSPKSRRVLNIVAVFVAGLLFVGFMAMPLAVLFGGIK